MVIDTPKRDAEATKAAIREAAQQLFLEKGFADISLSNIASAAGVTKSLIHHHFGSKNNLWQEIKECFFGDYLDAQTVALAGSSGTLELLREAVTGYFTYLQHKPDFARLNSWMMLEADDSCVEMEHKVVEMGVLKIREAQAKGLIRNDLDADNIVIAFLSLVENWFLGARRWRRTHFKHLSEDEVCGQELDNAYLADILEIFFEGIRPREEPKT